MNLQSTKAAPEPLDRTEVRRVDRVPWPRSERSRPLLEALFGLGNLGRVVLQKGSQSRARLCHEHEGFAAQGWSTVKEALGRNLELAVLKFSSVKVERQGKEEFAYSCR